MLFNDEVEPLPVKVLDLYEIWDAFILLDGSSPFFGFTVRCFLLLTSLTVELIDRVEMLLQEKVLGLRGFESKFVSKSNKLSSSSSC
jgi:hypothetical protein